VNIGRNHRGNDCLMVSACEIFGVPVDQTADSSDFAFPPRGGSRAPVDGTKPWPHTGAIAFAEVRPHGRNNVNPFGLGRRLLPPQTSALSLRSVPAV
jgi:hypothetical protein